MFRVRGEVRLKHGWEVFSKEIAASSKEDARERIFSNVGSNYHIPRRFIKIDVIEKVVEAPAEEKEEKPEEEIGEQKEGRPGEKKE